MCIKLEYFCCFIEGDSLSTPSQDVFSTCTDQDEHEITEQVGFVVKETESFTTQAEGTYLYNLLSFFKSEQCFSPNR